MVQGKKVSALWDTGDQVCVPSKCWKEVNLPNKPVRDRIELLGEDDLSLQAANGTKIECDGWIEVELQVAGAPDGWGSRWLGRMGPQNH